MCIKVGFSVGVSQCWGAVMMSAKLVTGDSDSRGSSESSGSDNYVLVPPEGGWGYIVCVGLSVIFVSIKIID